MIQNEIEEKLHGLGMRTCEMRIWLSQPSLSKCHILPHHRFILNTYSVSAQLLSCVNERSTHSPLSYHGET